MESTRIEYGGRLGGQLAKLFRRTFIEVVCSRSMTRDLLNPTDVDTSEGICTTFQSALRHSDSSTMAFIWWSI